ncbi:hypothetical protein BDFB_008945 [Asbolus verrucosus]|uniref:Uncharacterized protein n=1 Tax=Asbolus verrucosus TaxID=1661398 RepID=A0A482W0U0_ASBVE|nr:hypothetical protein BDFB_008945 [Asbolus verrucosus]
MFVTVVFVFIFLKPSILQDISPLVDVKTLSELPLEKLLQVKNTFKEPELVKIEKKADSPSSPEALALQAKRKPNDRGGYHNYHSYEEEHSKKSGKKSVQSIFQISVTALAFLAFGGYLLCLLVQAIKGKNYMVMMETTTMAPMAAYIRPRPVRRRPTRRPLKQQRPPRQPYNTRPARPKREIWPEADPESMYYALVHLSEAYASYNTIDYSKFNYTSSSYN